MLTNRPVGKFSMLAKRHVGKGPVTEECMFFDETVVSSHATTMSRPIIFVSCQTSFPFGSYTCPSVFLVRLKA